VKILRSVFIGIDANLPKISGRDYNFSEWRGYYFRMVMLLEAIALLLLVAISLTGFTAAVAWTFAIWFGNRG
jgi:hypothetical protein